MKLLWLMFGLAVASSAGDLSLQPSATKAASPALTPRTAPALPEAFPDRRQAWDRDPPAPARAIPGETLFRQAEKQARLANEALYRCRRYVDGWLAHADPASGLIPRNLTNSRDYWNGRDSAADNYPFMVLTASLTDRSLLSGRLLDLLRAEQRLTARVDRLSDDYANYPWEGQSADGYADSIEGAINLIKREPVASAGAWIDSEMRVMWAKQQPDGVIEGWHGDGLTSSPSGSWLGPDRNIGFATCRKPRSFQRRAQPCSKVWPSHSSRASKPAGLLNRANEFRPTPSKHYSAWPEKAPAVN